MSAPEIAVAYVSIVPSLQGFQRTLREQVVGPSEDAGDDSATSISQRLRDGLKKGALGAAVVAGAVITKGIADAIDQANVTSKLQAQLGASGQDAARYGKIAGTLYSSGVTETFEGAAEAIKTVMQSGIAPPGATNKQLQEIATKASDVASVFDQDLGGVTNAVSQLMRTGLAKSSTQAFDLITKGLTSSANKADDLLDTINEYSVQFKRVGLDGATSLGLISQAVAAGARDSDQVADAIGQFGERALAGGKAVEDAYKSIGLSATDMASKIGKGGSSAKDALAQTLNALRGTKDEQVKLNAAAALFGDPANVMGDSLYAMNVASAAASAGFDKATGSTDKLGSTIRSGPSYELQVFTRSMQQGLVRVLGKYAIPALTATGKAANAYLVPALRATLTASVSAFRFMRTAAPWIAPLAVAIAGIALALNAQAIATGFVTAVFSVYRAALIVGTTVTSGFAAAQALLNAVMALNPFVLVAIALAALVVGIVIAYKKSETFRAIVSAAWKGIKDSALAVANWFMKSFLPFFTRTIPNAFNTTIAWVKAHWPLILSIITGPIGAAVIYVVRHWDQLKSDTMRIIGSAVSWVTTKWDSLVKFFKNAPGRITRATAGMFDGLKDAFRAAINFIIRGWNGLRFSIPAVDTHIPGVGKVGGTSFGVPQIPFLAKGGVVARSGLAVVGEAGPELLRLPSGAEVRPLRRGVDAPVLPESSTSARGAGPVYVTYSAPTPESPHKAAMEIGRRVTRAVVV